MNSETALSRLKLGYELFDKLAYELLSQSEVLLGEADPPETSGVYLLLLNGEIRYVGEAKGSGGLRDRLLRKHISGDDKHAIQRALKDEFPNRALRREYIKKNVSAKWVVVEDFDAIAVLERLLFWLLGCPAWNKK